MIPFEPWIAFVLGLVVGSFLNVCIHRLPRELTVWSPARSFCPHCEKSLAWYDNVPVLSYLMLRGRCRHCGAAISWRYPAVELLTAILFAFIASLGLPGEYTAKFVVFAANLVTLEDDRHDQPIYAPVPIMREAALVAHPQVAGIVKPLMRSLDAGTLRTLNARVQIDGESAQAVAADYLKAHGWLH